jgi:hypothetical protein
MLKRYPFLSSVLLVGGAVALFFFTRPVSAAPTAAPVKYEACTPSRDGIGKVWMGREISHVMGHPGIGWLERTDREKEEAPSKAIALLELAPDAVLADIGAERDDFGLIRILDPGQQDGGVETPRVGENDLFHVTGRGDCHGLQGFPRDCF